MDTDLPWRKYSALTFWVWHALNSQRSLPPMLPPLFSAFRRTIKNAHLVPLPFHSIAFPPTLKTPFSIPSYHLPWSNQNPECKLLNSHKCILHSLLCVLPLLSSSNHQCISLGPANSLPTPLCFHLILHFTLPINTRVCPQEFAGSGSHSWLHFQDHLWSACYQFLSSLGVTKVFLKMDRW